MIYIYIFKKTNICGDLRGMYSNKPLYYLSDKKQTNKLLMERLNNV